MLQRTAYNTNGAQTRIFFVACSETLLPFCCPFFADEGLGMTAAQHRNAIHLRFLRILQRVQAHALKNEHDDLEWVPDGRRLTKLWGLWHNDSTTFHICVLLFHCTPVHHSFGQLSCSRWFSTTLCVTCFITSQFYVELIFVYGCKYSLRGIIGKSIELWYAHELS